MATVPDRFKGYRGPIMGLGWMRSRSRDPITPVATSQFKKSKRMVNAQRQFAQYYVR